MNERLAFLLNIGCICLVYAQSVDPRLRLEVLKDTIIIGEPMIMKCILVNPGNKACVVYGAPSDPLLTSGTIGFIMKIPSEDTDFHYGVYSHVLTSTSPSFILEPFDSIYWYSVLNWSSWAYASNKINHLHDLPVGHYKIKFFYLLPTEDLTKMSQITSNIDSFFAVKMTKDELNIFKEANEFIDHFFGYPGNMSVKIYKKMQKVLPKLLNIKSNSIILQFCHYVYAYTAPLPERIELCESFMREYPDSPLSEEIEFWLARAYESIGKIDAYFDAHKKYPDNIKGYYYRNLRKKVKGHEK